MGAHVAHPTLNTHRLVEYLGRDLVLANQLLKFNALFLGSSQVELTWGSILLIVIGYRRVVCHGADKSVTCLVYLGIVGCTILHHSRRIPNRRPGLHRSKRRDLSDSIRSISLQAILNNLATTVVRKFHVNVRHLPTLDIQETLEEQPIGQGIEVRDLQTVQHQARSRRTTNRRQYPLLLDEPEDVPDHQKIVRKIRRLNDVKLFFEPLLHLIRDLPETIHRTFIADLPQVLSRRHPVRRRILRQLRPSLRELQRATLRNRQCVVKGFRMLREYRRHLRRRLHVVAVILHPQSLRVCQLARCNNACQRVLMRRILWIDVVTVIRHYEVNAHLR